MGTVKPIRIIGIDPGLANTGWGVIESRGSRLSHLEHGCIETLQEQENAMRLLEIANGLEAVLNKWQPVIGGIENLYFARNVKTAIPVAQGRGVACLVLARAGVAVCEFTPNAIKTSVTGIGNADKNQVQQMVRLLLGLDDIPRPDHAADALAAAICAANNRI
ncbi:MAG: crossover junction endodeoxyribonuclease RuvC [Termitinemataceae bacterium]|nr:MAG: crossover junction endodeoxyribonuclease RuvC [Termitinemataceae bacterium]